jgi:tetratricopeptide (TPR) repeat protein
MTKSVEFADSERADAALVVRLLGTLARSASSQPGSEVELRLLRACTTVAADMGVADELVADCLAQLGFCLTERQDEDAVPMLEREVAIRAQHPDPAALAAAYGRLARALENTGQMTEAVQALAEGCTAAGAAGADELAAVLLFDRARILGSRLARFGDALQTLQVAQDMGRKSGDPELQERVEGQLRAALAWILRMAGDAEDAGDTASAEQHYRLVNASGRTADLRDLAARAQCNHARMLAATLGRPGDALALAEEAVALAREGMHGDLLEQAQHLVLAIRRDLDGP